MVTQAELSCWIIHVDSEAGMVTRWAQMIHMNFKKSVLATFMAQIFPDLPHIPLLHHSFTEKPEAICHV